MIRNVLLTGGPAHDFPGAARTLVDVFDEVGIATTLVSDPHAAIAAVTSGRRDAPDPTLLTVHALRWRMEQERYADLAEEQAFALDPDAADALERHVRGGGALLALHTAVICFDAAPAWARLCGAAWSWERSAHPPLGPVEVVPTPDGRAHPITAGVEAFTVTDEVYGALDEQEDLVPLLTSTHGGRAHPVLWARSVGAGRVVTDVLGHDAASLTHPAHRRIVARAALWATRRLHDV